MHSTSSTLQDYRDILISVAQNSIQQGLETQQPKVLNLSEFDPILQTPRATFVTLQKNKDLRGCIGTLEAHQPLILDVSKNAFSAAFQDPRLSPVTHAECNILEIHISVLSLPEPMSFESEQDLIDQLRPGVDGLILEDQGHRGTFLPSVWQSLTSTRSFLTQLKLKAGLDKNYWSDSIKISRYITEVIDS